VPPSVTEAGGMTMTTPWGPD